MRRKFYLSGLAKWSVGFYDSWYNNFSEVKLLYHHSKSIYYYKPSKLKLAIEQGEGRMPVRDEYKQYLVCHNTTHISLLEKKQIIYKLKAADFRAKYPQIKVEMYNPKLHNKNPYAQELPIKCNIFSGDPNEQKEVKAVTTIGEDIILLGYQLVNDEFRN